MIVTRRQLLEQIGAIGGIGATYTAMEALGLTVATPAGAENFTLPRQSGDGKSVIILGAGIAGLVSAFELQRAGYHVTVLEARDRVAGRVWTIRGGDRIVQAGRKDQRATFGEGLYFNAGAARIPSSHRAILGYARRLGVPMEVMVNANRSAGWDFRGSVQPERRMVNDMRGRLAELLAKAIDQHALDSAASKGELEMIRQFLAPYAELDAKGVYSPQGRSGYALEGGAYRRAPVPLAPLSWAEPRIPLFVRPDLGHAGDDAAACRRNGPDRARHLREVKPLVRLKRPVSEVRRVGDRVRVMHGAPVEVMEADYCICTLPAPLVARVKSDLSRAKKVALGSVEYRRHVKVAFESPRFWETEDGVYGGLAWTDRLNENVMYPSGGFNDRRGILVAAYCGRWTRPENPEAFSALSHEERFRICRDSIEALHPGKSRLLDKGVTVAWGLTPWSEGGGAVWPGG